MKKLLNTLLPAMMTLSPFVTSAQLNQAGKLDNSFGKNGTVTTNDSFYTEAMCVTADNKILLGQGWIGFYGDNVYIKRFNNDGSTDQGFGANGTAELSFPGYTTNRVMSMAIQKDGKILLGMTSTKTQALHDWDMVVARLDAEGKLDTSFNHTGYVAQDIGNQSNTTSQIAVAPNGDIIVAGITSTRRTTGVVLKYKSTGEADHQFGNQGVVQIPALGQADPGTESVSLSSLIIRSDNKIIVGGDRNGLSMAPAKFLTCFDLAGRNDPAFQQDTLGDYVHVKDMEMLPGGDFLVAGETANINTSTPATVLARYKANGTRDKSFGKNGAVSMNQNENYVSQPYGKTLLAVAPNNQILVTGRWGNDPKVNCYKANGDKDTTFADSGVLHPQNFIYAMAMQSTGKFVTMHNDVQMTQQGYYAGETVLNRYIGPQNNQLTVQQIADIQTEKLYPVPANDFVTLEDESEANQTKMVEIFGTNGQLVQKQEAVMDQAGKTTLNTGNLNNGQYLLRTTNAQKGKVSVHNVLIMR